MNKFATASILGALTLASGSAMAWGRVGVEIGVPIGYPGPYYSPYYYPQVVVQQAAPVYVEQPVAPVAPAPAAASGNYWYYCTASRGYYPYVKECPGGWQRVSPQPPGQP